jgi:hypothetical protein
MSRALDPETGAALSYTLDFSGPGGESLSRNVAAGSSSLTLFLSPGEWTIRADAFLDGELYGTGETSVTVEAGKTNEAAIVMRQLNDSGDWYMTVYVKQGAAGGDGTKWAPFATVSAALNKIQTEYAAPDWPGYQSDNPAPARILISGTIQRTGDESGHSFIKIKDPDLDLYENLPPITLAGYDSGGTIDAGGGADMRVLCIESADVTLGPNLTLTGGRVSTPGGGAGVYVVGGKFTMNGGKISDNTASGTSPGDGGGGVYVGHSGTFLMTGGTISRNTASPQGGGVYVFNFGTFEMRGGTIGGSVPDANRASGGPTSGGGVFVETLGVFTMSGGSISYNHAGADGGGVYFLSGSTFNMSGGSISDNEVISSTATVDACGGGVYFLSGGTFNMSGGNISRNKVISSTAGGKGGGVYFYDGGTLDMSGGSISDNEVTFAIPADSGGGGVYLYDSGNGITFCMSGGSISGNKVNPSTMGGNGGGVYVGGTGSGNSSFEMFGTASISNNQTASDGGGVYIGLTAAAGDFNMSGGTIGNNSAGNYGGGLYYSGNQPFTMGGTAEISRNTAMSGGGVYVVGYGFKMRNTAKISDNIASGTGATDGGGGVYISNTSSFYMYIRGTISGNRSAGSGGGVFVASGGYFEKTGGTIYGDTKDGSTPEDDALKNTAGGDGQAVYVETGPERRNTTAGPTATLDSSQSGSSGGWE